MSDSKDEIAMQAMSIVRYLHPDKCIKSEFIGFEYDRHNMRYHSYQNVPGQQDENKLITKQSIPLPNKSEVASSPRHSEFAVSKSSKQQITPQIETKGRHNISWGEFAKSLGVNRYLLRDDDKIGHADYTIQQMVNMRKKKKIIASREFEYNAPRNPMYELYKLITK